MKSLTVQPSSISGLGVFAAETVEAGEEIAPIDGRIVSLAIVSKEDSLSNPDWIGIHRHRWVDPTGTFKFLNHSCEPNVGVATPSDDVVLLFAMKNINPGEELTLDYSTTEIDSLWEMSCRCRSNKCRKIIRSIVSLPRSTYDEYAPFIPKSFQEFYKINVRK